MVLDFRDQLDRLAELEAAGLAQVAAAQAEREALLQAEKDRAHRPLYDDFLDRCEKLSEMRREQASWASLLNVVPDDSRAISDLEDRVSQARENLRRVAGFSV